MGLRREEGDYPPNDYENWDEGEESLSHKRQVKKRLEEKLESRRLRRELDDFDEDEDEDYWDGLDRE